MGASRTKTDLPESFWPVTMQRMSIEAPGSGPDYRTLPAVVGGQTE
jgi:hypothetical protein